MRLVGWNSGFFGGLEMFHSLKALRCSGDLYRIYSTCSTCSTDTTDRTYRTYRTRKNVSFSFMANTNHFRQMWLKQLLTPGAIQREAICWNCAHLSLASKTFVFCPRISMLSPHVQAHMGIKNSKSMHLNCRVGSQQTKCRKTAVVCCDLY